MKTTLVIGASEKQDRYSNIAIKLLSNYNHKVFAIGNKLGKIGDINIEVGIPIFENVDTITLYINSKLQIEYYNYILALHPKRIIFNPGTENEELFQLAKENKIDAIEACTLVMLKTNQY